MCRGIEREQQKERDPKVSVNGTEGGFDALRTHDEEAGFSACVVAALVFTLSQRSCVSSTVFAVEFASQSSSGESGPEC